MISCILRKVNESWIGNRRKEIKKIYNVCARSKKAPITTQSIAVPTPTQWNLTEQKCEGSVALEKHTLEIIELKTRSTTTEGSFVLCMGAYDIFVRHENLVMLALFLNFNFQKLPSRAFIFVFTQKLEPPYGSLSSKGTAIAFRFICVSLYCGRNLLCHISHSTIAL